MAGKTYSRSKCDFCGVVTQAQNMGRHVHNNHAHQLNERKALGIEGDPWMRVEAPTTRPPRGVARPTTPKPSRRSAPATLDIVVPVLTMLFDGPVPLNRLEAVLRWSEQTAQFLKEVAG